MTTIRADLNRGLTAAWPSSGLGWQPEAAAMLDQQHLAAWSADELARHSFAAGLGRFLSSQPFSQVVPIFGQTVTDLESFCEQLERSIPGPPLRRSIDGSGGVASLLRSREVGPGMAAPRCRYYIWHDCDAMIQADPELFGRLAEAIIGIAAEDEFVSDDLLMIHRAVFLGGSLLAVYHEDESAQLRSWSPEPLGEPFWKTISGVESPEVLGTDLADLADRLWAQPEPVFDADELITFDDEDSGGW